MKKILTVFLLMTNIVLARDLTLDQAIDLSLNNSKEMRISEKNLDISKLNVSKAFKNALPSVKYTGAYTVGEHERQILTQSERNYEVFNEENFKKLKDIACIMIDLVKEVLTKYKKDINIEEKDIEKCSKMIFSIAEVFLIMENVDFDSDRFTFKTLDEVKKMYRSDDIKDHFEFIKKSIKKIIY